MSLSLKIVVPMAGLGTRLRPHTWSKPKPLVALAGRTVLDYVLDMFKTVPYPETVEYVFITGLMGDQIKDHMHTFYPQVKVQYVVQPEMRGQSDALYLARQHLTGPMIMAFADTLVETDFSFLRSETSDGIAWVKEVSDPRRFGVAEVNHEGQISRLIEKPQDARNNLVVVGFYYFREGQDLMSAIEEQMHRGVTLKGEYFLADAVNILLERGAKMRTHPVDTWLDAGTSDSILATNRYLLDHGWDNSEQVKNIPNSSIIIPPVYIHPGAEIECSVIGPHVSISADCKITSSILRDCIVEEGAHVTNSLLEGSLLGRDVQVVGQALHLNLGDQSWAMR
jgi:glucose-1-phosphate thymidylyltransferase